MRFQRSTAACPTSCPPTDLPPAVPAKTTAAPAQRPRATRVPRLHLRPANLVRLLPAVATAHHLCDPARPPKRLATPTRRLRRRLSSELARVVVSRKCVRLGPFPSAQCKYFKRRDWLYGHGTIYSRHPCSCASGLPSWADRGDIEHMLGRLETGPSVSRPALGPSAASQFSASRLFFL